ncbi:MULTISPECIES: NAD(P)-binding domain-containing protein [Actinomadura]|uniref:UDP-glucose 6-dehydrogenase n=1 Tax=Actinomadura yumaensis TaxID=111807 RepID=A0ABW2CJ45_9ACTN|nr:NAD(P)-binding domain-containing protein [Actinomadura sp. J1-007]
MANILIVGAGVVGTATGLGFSRHDHKIAFIDVDPSARRRAGELGFVAAAAGAVDLTEADVVFVAVPTPTGRRGCDLSRLRETAHALGTALKRVTPDAFPVIVYRCTAPPGTTREMAAILQAVSGRRAGADFGVAYNPEYLRAHRAVEDFATPPVVTIGVVDGDRRVAEVLRCLYRPFGARIVVTGVEEAEFQKYVHNLFNAVKISFFNEMRGAAARLGLRDVDEIFEITARSAEGMRNPSYGIADLGPYGGACLPKDLGAWLAEMRRLGVETPLAAAAREVNVRLGGR